MKCLIPPILTLCLLFSGCSLWNSTYVRVTPSSSRTTAVMDDSAPAETEEQLFAALQGMVNSGTESGVIYAVNMDSETLEASMHRAAEFVRTEDAVGAYAVDNIGCEVGTLGGKTAAAVTITYRRGAVEIRRILRIEDMAHAETAIYEALEDFTPRVVMLVENYEEPDIQQLVRDYAVTAPQVVMETPKVAQEIFGTGSERVIEISFSYSNSRESLRQMRETVLPVFDSAELYISGDSSDEQKLSQLHTFLTERFSYILETSITPAYSLLHHGVGDSSAFATVYAAMCRRSGLECLVVTGTRMGQPWSWNIVCDNGRYYHVDLLRNSRQTTFEERTDSEMTGYVWDYSAYPSCTRSPANTG